MKQMLIKSKTTSYPIYLGTDLLKRLEQYINPSYTSVLVITDQTVATYYLDDVMNALKQFSVHHIVIEPGEQSKSIEQFYDIHTKALSFGLDRHSLIIALGGGVVGDLAGFVAATFMRGIDFIQIPTTILAHDSSVGGKVAINHHLGKNLIGQFYVPKAVIYDVATLRTLDKREIRSGYAEIIKEALISDEAFFNDLLLTNIYQTDAKTQVNHLYHGMRIKASIVQQDEREQNIRRYLNFGHTLAHALEQQLGYGQLTHGEAVAIGLLFALYISANEYGNKHTYLVLLDWFKKHGYPLMIPKINVNDLLNRMKVDKKVVNRHIQMVLLKSVGQPELKCFTDREMVEYITSFFSELMKGIDK